MFFNLALTFYLQARICIANNFFQFISSAPFDLPFSQILISHTTVVQYTLPLMQSVAHPVPSHPSPVNPMC